MNKLQQHQIDLEELYSNHQLMPRMRKEFEECADWDFKAHIEAAGLELKFGIDLLVQMALHKRCDLVTLVGTLRHHCDKAQEVVDNIQLAIDAQLVIYDPRWSIFIVQFPIGADTQALLDRFQYPLPMVVEPKEVTSNKEAGYFTSHKSIILKDNHHDDDVCLDHINRMNRIPLKLNMDTANMVQNSWANLDKPKEGESKEDFQKRVRAFQKYDETAKDVMGVLLQESDVFYLTHRYDKRGRTYCQGHHVTYQGNAWNKAVIEFANEEVTNVQ